MSENVFGLQAEDEAPGPDPLADDAPLPAPEPEPEPDPDIPVGEPQTGEEQAEPQGGEEQERLAGKYTKVEDLEKGYKEVQAWATRVQQQNNDLAGQVGEMRMAMQQVAPVLQDLMQRVIPEEEEEALNAQRQLQELIDQQVAQRMEPYERNQVIAREHAEQVASITDFRSKYPDLEPNSPEDIELAQVVRELDLDIASVEALDIAYEAVRNPALRTVLRAHPEYVDSDEALAYARLQAQALPTGGQPQTGTAPGGSVRKAAAFVERGGSGAPAQASGKRGDEMDEAIAAFTKGRKGSIFGL